MTFYKSHLLWDYFEKTDFKNKKAKCRVCGDVYSYKATTGNLKTHLRKRHMEAYLIVQASRQAALSGNEQTAAKDYYITELDAATASIVVLPSEPAVATTTTVTTTDTITTTDTTPTTDSITTTGGKQQAVDVDTDAESDTEADINTITRYRYGTPKRISSDLKRKIDNDLLDLFIDSSQPFSLVEERAFKKFARWIPGYQLPTSISISNVMIPDLYNKTREKIQKEISLNASISLCLTVNLWTSRANESYLSVTAHYVTDDFKLKTILLECSHFKSSYTIINIQDVVNELVMEWNLAENVKFVVTSSYTQRANMNIGWEHFGCFGDTLNVIVQNAIMNATFLKKILDKVKTIVSFFNSSSSALAKLLKQQRTGQPDCIAKRLILDDPTTWNTTFLMINRFVELEPFIRSTVADIRKKLPVITMEEWTLLAETVILLKPFNDATERMRGDTYMTASSVIVITKCLVTACDKMLAENFSEPALQVIYSLKTGLMTKLGNIEKNDTLAICTFLDPRYKLAVFSDSNEAWILKKRVQDLLVDIIAEDGINSDMTAIEQEHNMDKFSHWEILTEILGQKKSISTPSSKATSEINSYINADILPARTGATWNCPFEWWRQHQDTYPNLAKLFTKYGNILAASVSCETIISKTRRIRDGRTRKTWSQVKQLTFLQVNLDPDRFCL